jgi:hypothetical protein
VPSAPRLLALALALLLTAACSCPPVVERYDSPESTLGTWQAQLCQDEAKGEYRCLSADFKSRMGNFSAYWTARRMLFDEEPLLRFALEHADLDEHVTDRWIDEETGTAQLSFEVRGHATSVGFRRETFLKVELDDGPPAVGRSGKPIAGLIGTHGQRSWIELTGTRLDLTDEQIQSATAILLEHRWKIDAIEGLMGATP